MWKSEFELRINYVLMYLFVYLFLGEDFSVIVMNELRFKKKIKFIEDLSTIIIFSSLMKKYLLKINNNGWQIFYGDFY